MKIASLEFVVLAHAGAAKRRMATSSSRTREPNFSATATTPGIVLQKLISLSCKLGPRVREDDGARVQRPFAATLQRVRKWGPRVRGDDGDNVTRAVAP